MTESPYWNPRHETMPRQEIEALQVRKLRNLLEWADAKVPWHSKRLRDAGVTPDSVKSLDDLRRIPFLTREEWMNGQLEDPPYGTMVAAPREAAIRYHKETVMRGVGRGRCARAGGPGGGLRRRRSSVCHVHHG
jgi:phenylacetate-CoA ligase